ncbi:methyltransferase family protein [Curtobacterium sp. PhB130]|uniref:class I SAM-dependent methyltransferase n=1 Tax=Curtobacterium sp. PhB130 TaxID=2485178 RepID=UPI000F4D09D4|nr:class I SAM-dependent methyltransferase [Curtobacterium sp. PhB130]ROS75792.1 methyltransferase family protein [Curtobacterium sp. PhB130]
MTFEQHAHSFGAAADAYERGRPGYPTAVAEWLAPEPVALAVDVGAGTGKFTRTLLPRASAVTAVEPDTAMRARLADALPSVPVVDGAGEAIPLADGAADLVTFAQSWHWVEPAAGAVEVARVLRPGGVLGLVWNIRDESLPWSARLGELLTRPESRITQYDHPLVGEPFDGGEYRTFPWVHEQSRSDFLDMVASRSYVIVMAADARDRLLRAVEELLDTSPETAGRSTVPVPYVAHVHRYVRP